MKSSALPSTVALPGQTEYVMYVCVLACVCLYVRVYLCMCVCYIVSVCVDRSKEGM